MKKAISGILTLMLALMLMSPAAICVSAATVSEGYLTYEISNGQATVTKCDKTAVGALEVPATLGGAPVTKIGSRAFFDCTQVTSIVLPETVSAIERSAFSACSAMEEMDLPDSLISIGEYAFRACRALREAVLPEGLTMVANNCFRDCTGLTRVSFPEGILSIGESAFQGCSAIEEFFLPESLQIIGSGAFSGCAGITQLTVPDGVTSIGEYALESCVNLAQLRLPEGLVSIGEGAFYHCNLTWLTVPASVTSIAYVQYGAFDTKTKIRCYAGSRAQTYAAAHYASSYVIVGDADGNSATEQADFVKVKTILLNGGALSAARQIAADMDESGALDIQDLVMLKVLLAA